MQTANWTAARLSFRFPKPKRTVIARQSSNKIDGGARNKIAHRFGVFSLANPRVNERLTTMKRIDLRRPDTSAPSGQVGPDGVQPQVAS